MAPSNEHPSTSEYFEKKRNQEEKQPSSYLNFVPGIAIAKGASCHSASLLDPGQLKLLNIVYEHSQVHVVFKSVLSRLFVVDAADLEVVGDFATRNVLVVGSIVIAPKENKKNGQSQ